MTRKTFKCLKNEFFFSLWGRSWWLFRKSISIISSSVPPWWFGLEEDVVVVGSAKGLMGRKGWSSADRQKQNRSEVLFFCKRKKKSCSTFFPRAMINMHSAAVFFSSLSLYLFTWSLRIYVKKTRRWSSRFFFLVWRKDAFISRKTY